MSTGEALIEEMITAIESNAELRARAVGVLVAVVPQVLDQVLGAHYVGRDDVGGILGLEWAALRKAEGAGELRGFRVGRRHVFKRVDVIEWVQSRASRPKKPVLLIEPQDGFLRAMARAERRMASGG